MTRVNECVEKSELLYSAERNGEHFANTVKRDLAVHQIVKGRVTI